MLCRGAIRYCVQAHVAKAGFDIKGEEAVVVLQPPLHATGPVSNSVEGSLTMCWCIPRGRAFAGLTADKDVYAGGEVAVVTVEARNSSGQKLRGVNVQLKRHVALWARNHKGPRWVDKVAVKSTPGIGLGQSLEGPTARRVELALPPDLPPTLAGTLVQCHYTLEVELQAGRGVSSIRVSVPVCIGAASLPPSSEAVEVPPDWKPTKVYSTIVALPEAAA